MRKEETIFLTNELLLKITDRDIDKYNTEINILAHPAVAGGQEKSR